MIRDGRDRVARDRKKGFVWKISMKHTIIQAGIIATRGSQLGRSPRDLVERGNGSIHFENLLGAQDSGGRREEAPPYATDVDCLSCSSLLSIFLATL